MEKKGKNKFKTSEEQFEDFFINHIDWIYKDYKDPNKHKWSYEKKINSNVNFKSKKNIY
jgi:hypothetical protein